MNDSLIQANAERKVLEYKLDCIRNYILNRISIVDLITKVELENILLQISKYETVPINWSLKVPFVNEEDLNNVQ